ncbi:MAG: RecQ family ATP-dependent DNA helicase [bacterium]|nr:RecQ family ATP-dependent DNA helicase [bacterium]
MKDAEFYEHIKQSVKESVFEKSLENSVGFKVRGVHQGVNLSSLYGDSYFCNVFQSISLPIEVIQTIDDSNKDALKGLSFWKLDLPLIDGHDLDDITKQVICVLQKILMRGKWTILSPDLEKNLMDLLGINSISLDDLTQKVNDILSCSYFHVSKDVGIRDRKKRDLYCNFFSNLLGSDYYKFVIPDFDLRPILNYYDLSHYFEFDVDCDVVDFIIFHPFLEKCGRKAVAVSIRDLDPDFVLNFIMGLNKAGIDFIEVPIESLDFTDLDYVKSKIEHALLDNQFVRQLVEIKNNSLKSNNSGDKFVNLINVFRVVHQLQVSISKALEYGFLKFQDFEWNLVTDIDRIWGYELASKIVEFAVEDLTVLLKNILRLYSSDVGIPQINLFLSSNIDSCRSGIYFCFTGYAVGGDLTKFYISDIYLPFDIRSMPIIGAPLVREGLVDIDLDNLRFFLRYIFRKEDFWEGQFEAIRRILEKKDTIVLLPTGGGKSMIYWLSSLLLPGVTVVIDPIISLMEDQILGLCLAGIDRTVAISSVLDSEERQRSQGLLSSGEFLFVFVAPERFQMEDFRIALRSLTDYNVVSLIVIDEAHCISEWGHDFRVSYLNIGRNSREFCRSGDFFPSIVALTATASRRVLNDIQRELDINDPEATVTPKTFDRKNLRFRIIFCDSYDHFEKFSRLKNILENVLPAIYKVNPKVLYEMEGEKSYGGLIFCSHVNGDYGVYKVNQNIRKMGIKSFLYSGERPKDFDCKNFDCKNYGEYKRKVSKSFKRNRVSLLVCTKAFGMGIDKPNIRYTVHYNLPPSIEAFYQEAGRAGRDRKDSYCFIILSLEHKSVSWAIQKVNRVQSVSRDDVDRMLYFHSESFPGKDVEIGYLQWIVDDLREQNFDLSQKGDAVIYWNKRGSAQKAKNMLEKTIYRLKILGVVFDYTINYAGKNFKVAFSGATKEEIIGSYFEYISKYIYSRALAEKKKAEALLSEQDYERFVFKMFGLLLEFVYENIEEGRRVALREMLLACQSYINSKSPEEGDKNFRQYILRYLEETDVSDDLRSILENKENAGLTSCMDIFQKYLNSKKDLDTLRGQNARYLVEYPDYPPFLMIRALTEVFSKNRNDNIIKQYFVSSITYSFGSQKYIIDKGIAFDFLKWGIDIIKGVDFNLANQILFELLHEFENSENISKRINVSSFSKTLANLLSLDLCQGVFLYRLDKLNEKVSETLSLFKRKLLTGGDK